MEELFSYSESEWENNLGTNHGHALDKDHLRKAHRTEEATTINIGIGCILFTNRITNVSY